MPLIILHVLTIGTWLMCNFSGEQPVFMHGLGFVLAANSQHLQCIEFRWCKGRLKKLVANIMAVATGKRRHV